MATLLTLGDFLRAQEHFAWNHALYVSGRTEWQLGTKCAVLDPDDVESDEADRPTFALQHGLSYALSISQVQDVVANLTQQRAETTLEEQLVALRYFHAHDAFITLGTAV